MPWRSERNPYQIWLSEIILQQTRVEQGLPYYLKFIKTFPTVNDLAAASEDEVLNLWQGLGYYSRARNLHAAAKCIVGELKGKFPATYADLLKLKGVGEYTAAAIASMAYDLPHAVVDGNVFRVLSRVYKIDLAIDSSAGRRYFFDLANELIDKKCPGDHNQGLMEIGSLVCFPAKPACRECPLQSGCLSYADGTFAQYPVKAGKTAVRDRHFNYLVITDGKSVILKKRVEKDIWTGLYDFRLIESEWSESDMLLEIKKLKPSKVDKDGAFKHVLSHQRIFANFWLINVKKVVELNGEIKVAIEQLDDFPMPRLLIRYLEQSNLKVSE